MVVIVWNEVATTVELTLSKVTADRVLDSLMNTVDRRLKALAYIVRESSIQYARIFADSLMSWASRE